MRFRKLAPVVGIVLLVLACSSQRRAPGFAGAPSDIALEIFYNRALKQTPLNPGQQPDPAKVKQLNDSQIGQIYKTIDPARSLLMYDCGQSSTWCNQAQFGFPMMMKTAALMSRPIISADPLFTNAWTQAKSMDNALPAIASLSMSNLQLLAIANRMDMAELNGNTWSGAEIHLAYGPVPGPGESPVLLTVIVEFALTPISRPAFQALAKQWIGLKDASCSDYPGCLSQTIQAMGIPICPANGSPCPTGVSKIHHVNLRFNHALGGPSWVLSQLRLATQTSAFIPAVLDNQLRSAIGPGTQGYLNIWNAAQGIVSQGGTTYEVGATYSQDLQPSPLPYADEAQGLGTPISVGNPNINVRNLLALQECTGCHTVETKPSAAVMSAFNHLPNRAPASPTKPSEFLIGKGPLRPDMVDLYYPNPNVVSTVQISYRGANGSTQQVTRYFHDVARRTLFLAAASLDAPLNHPLFNPSPFSTNSVE